MSETSSTSPPQPYLNFADPPPHAIGTDALLGRVVRRLFEVGARHEDGLAGVLQVVLTTLDDRPPAAGNLSR